jgi:hypothetical protein
MTERVHVRMMCRSPDLGGDRVKSLSSGVDLNKGWAGTHGQGKPLPDRCNTVCVCSSIWDEVLGKEGCAGETGARCALCPRTPRSSLRIPSTGIGSASRAHGRGGAHGHCLCCSALLCASALILPRCSVKDLDAISCRDRSTSLCERWLS